VIQLVSDNKIDLFFVPQLQPGIFGHSLGQITPFNIKRIVLSGHPPEITQFCYLRGCISAIVAQVTPTGRISGMREMPWENDTRINGLKTTP
jgi:hypothetical protein